MTLPRFALLVIAIAPFAGAANPPAPFSRAPYLQFGSPTMMHVVWRTEGPVEPVVRFGTSVEKLDREVSGQEIVVRASLGSKTFGTPKKWEHLQTRANLALPKLHSAPVGTFQYEAKVAGLEPETKYFYAVYDGAKRLTAEDASYHFITHPKPGGPERNVRFWALGDSGTGRVAQKEVHDAMVRETAKQPLDFWMHLGDMAYTAGRDLEFQTRFFEMYEGTLRNRVCWPTMGNHEGATSSGKTGIGPYYDAYVVPMRGETGGVASGTEAYYSFDYANVHFICLDSHDLSRKPGEPMANWLKADLEKTKAEWVIAFWHHPPYTKGTHDSDKETDLIEMRKYILPIIEAGGVDLVLTGHSHIYERSMLLDGAYATPTVSENVVFDDGDGDPDGDGAYRKSEGIHAHEGTVHVVAGHGGTQLGRAGTMPVMRRAIVEHGSVIVDVKGDTLICRMINREGEESDVFSIVKRGKVTPVRHRMPWLMSDYKKPEDDSKAKPGEPVDRTVLVAPDAKWTYTFDQPVRGKDWTLEGFDATGWKEAAAPFGYGRVTASTDVRDMRRKSAVLYARREFTIGQLDRINEVGLQIDYADAFIAYINGREVARSNIARSSGRNAQGVKSRDTLGSVYMVLGDAMKALKDGANVLAIEAHNATADEADFLLSPSLVTED